MDGDILHSLVGSEDSRGKPSEILYSVNFLSTINVAVNNLHCISEDRKDHAGLGQSFMNCCLLLYYYYYFYYLYKNWTKESVSLQRGTK
jgi:hypothetical protein